VAEFLTLIPELTTAKEGQAFHVVAPSLPGYGWSEAPKSAGFGAPEAASLLNKLMIQLGYEHYAVQGGTSPLT